MYEIVKRHAESDYLATLKPEQKSTFHLLQSARMPDGSRVPGVVPEKNSYVHQVEIAGAVFYHIFLTDDASYTDTREAIKATGAQSAGEVVRILASAVAGKTGMEPSSCMAYTVYLIVTILRAGFSVTLEGFSQGDRHDSCCQSD